MVGFGLKRRVGDLEARSGGPNGPKKWHRMFQYEGQTQEQAIAAYEAENGPLGPDDGAILRVIIHKPFPAPEPAPCIH